MENHAPCDERLRSEEAVSRGPIGASACRVPIQNRWLSLSIVPALMLLTVIQDIAVWRSIGATVDEPLYRHCGSKYFGERSCIDLVEAGVAPLPIVLADWLPFVRSKISRLEHDSDDKTATMPALIREARIANSVLVGVPIVLVVYYWLLRRRDWLAGLVGGGLIALSPTMLAHGSIATTESCIALFILLSLASLVYYLNHPSGRSLISIGLAMGLAFASKLTAVVLLPIAALALWLSDKSQPPETTRTGRVLRRASFTVSRLLAVCAFAALVFWAVCGFGLAPALDAKGSHESFRKVFGSSPRVDKLIDALVRLEVPAPLAILRFQLGHSVSGHDTYLMGSVSKIPSWRYFPIAFLVKSTPTELLLAVAVALLVVTGQIGGDRARLLWVLAIAFLTALLLRSRLGLGHRYMAALYPILILCAVDWLFGMIGGRKRLALVCAMLLLVTQAVSSASIGPYYLSYFNSLVGGPIMGHEYLVDSNIDWGQDLPALAEELKRLGARAPILAYFGTDDPQNYGIAATHWEQADHAAIAAADFLALSVTWLHGAYLEGRDPFRDFRHLKPTGRAAYSILIYDLSDPTARAALRSSKDRYDSPENGDSL